MMNGREKSDSAIVAKKLANNVGEPAAEWVERRAGTKRNMGQSNTCRAQNRASVPHGLERVRQAAKQRKKERFRWHGGIGCSRNAARRKPTRLPWDSNRVHL